MESPKTIDALLDDLRALSPNGAEYLDLMICDLEVFNVEEYRAKPERARHSLPNLEDDLNELQNEINCSIQDGADKASIQSILERIALSIAKKNVTSWALYPMFRYFDALREDDNDHELSEDTSVRFYTPNLLFDRRQLDEFYRACGFKEDTKGGNGSHTKWIDTNGTIYAVGSCSKKSWLKNNIKSMLQAGFPVDRIQMACDSLRIAFVLLNR